MGLGQYHENFSTCIKKPEVQELKNIGQTKPMYLIKRSGGGFFWGGAFWLAWTMLVGTFVETKLLAS